MVKPNGRGVSLPPWMNPCARVRPFLPTSCQVTVPSNVLEQPWTLKPLETRSPLAGDSTKTMAAFVSAPSVFEQTFLPLAGVEGCVGFAARATAGMAATIRPTSSVIFRICSSLLEVFEGTPARLRVPRPGHPFVVGVLVLCKGHGEC